MYCNRCEAFSNHSTVFISITTFSSVVCDVIVLRVTSFIPPTDSAVVVVLWW